MTEGEGDAGSPGESDDPFIGGILDLFGYFRTLHPDPHLTVEVTLTNAGSYLFNGLHADFTDAAPACVMLRGWESPPEQALIVRVRDIITVAISPTAPDPGPMGFPGREV
jgi:hypothetical protein